MVGRTRARSQASLFLSARAPRESCSESAARDRFAPRLERLEAVGRSAAWTGVVAVVRALFKPLPPLDMGRGSALRGMTE